MTEIPDVFQSFLNQDLNGGRENQRSIFGVVPTSQLDAISGMQRLTLGVCKLLICFSKQMGERPVLVLVGVAMV